MKESIVNYAISLLDTHYGYYMEYNKCNNPNAKTQLAYYSGLFTMLEIIISDDYTKKQYIARDDEGKHAIIYK